MKQKFSLDEIMESGKKAVESTVAEGLLPPPGVIAWSDIAGKVPLCTKTFPRPLFKSMVTTFLQVVDAYVFAYVTVGCIAIASEEKLAKAEKGELDFNELPEEDKDDVIILHVADRTGNSQSFVAVIDNIRTVPKIREWRQVSNVTGRLFVKTW